MELFLKSRIPDLVDGGVTQILKKKFNFWLFNI